MKKNIFKILLPALVLYFNLLQAQNEITPTWSHIADATHSDMVRDLWVTAQGESYMFGDISFLDDVFDHQGMMLLKLDNSGEEEWRTYIHGATVDWKAVARGVVGDTDGNVYIIYDEYREPPFNNQRVVAKKYNAEGIELWSHYLTPEIDNRVEQLVTGSVVLKGNYIYATGTQHISADVFEEVFTDGFVYKIDISTGNAVKIIHDSDEFGGDDFLLESRVDNNGNIYSIGRSKSFIGEGGTFDEYDSVLVKFSPAGNKLWEHWLNGEADAEDFGISITLDIEGNIYTSNQLKKINIPVKEVVVQKLSPEGEVIWTYNYQGSDTEDLWRQPLEVLPNGNIALVVSNIDGIVTIVLNGSTGAEIWSDNYNRNTTGFGNHHRDMAVDAQGNIYITGTSKSAADPGASKDIVTIKYNSNGDMAWLSNFNYTDYFNFGDDGVTLALDGAGNVYTAGWVYQVGANAEFLLLKYGDAIMGTDGVKGQGLVAYPNPVIDVVNIELPQNTSAGGITLYDLNGRVIKNWNKTYDVGSTLSLDLQGVSQGLYLVTLQSEKGLFSIKVYKK